MILYIVYLHCTDSQYYRIHANNERPSYSKKSRFLLVAHKTVTT